MINPNPHGDNLRNLGENYLRPQVVPPPNNQLVVRPPPPAPPAPAPPPRQPRQPYLSNVKKKRMKKAVIFDKKFLMGKTLKDLREEIKQQFPGKFTEEELKKITGKNKEKYIDDYFKDEPEVDQLDQEIENHFHDDHFGLDQVYPFVDDHFAVTDNPLHTRFNEKSVAMSASVHYPHPSTFQTPIHETDFMSDDDDKSDSDDDDETRAISSAIKTVRNNISDMKNQKFTAPKTLFKNQTPLSSSSSSFGTQSAFSQPNFNIDDDDYNPNIYSRAFIDVLEDDQGELESIRKQLKSKKESKASKIPKASKRK